MKISGSHESEHNRNQPTVPTIVILIVAWLILVSSPVLAWQTESAGSVAPPKRTPLRSPDGITPETTDAIDRGLAYLARTQDRQGGWTNKEGGYGKYPVAMTALAGLALLMDGNTTTQGRYAPNVDRATTFLVRSLKPNGLLARQEDEARPMHGHGFALLYLSQVHGMIEDPARSQQLSEVITKAVQLTAKAQSPAGGWIYTPESRSDEGSVTITQVQALRSSRNAGFAVPKSVIDDAMQYLAKSQNSDGGIRYALNMQGPSRPPITAAAVCCWYNAGEYDNPLAKLALEYCKQEIKPQSIVGGHGFYAHLYFSQALFVSSDPLWEEYFRKRRDFLLGMQNPDGSWEGDSVGDVYGTAVALIILQLPFQQLPIMQR
ncbi:MAG: prenyltransferase/squalene oxidase repeat-containing protein [Planctomycetota bacterium]